MSNNLRRQMTSQWTYPVFGQSQNPYICSGRITSLLPLTLESEGNLLTFSVKGVRFFPREYQEVMGIGDLVSLRGQSVHEISEIQLLVPTLGEDLGKSSLDLQKKWINFRRYIREFFWSKYFDEVLTPSLVDCPGTEPYLKPFGVEIVRNKERAKKYLPTSPEINLKKYLSYGHTRIFELKECFRNDEFTRLHRPEFLMLEWYRAFSNLDAIAQDLVEMLGFLSERLDKNMGAITTVRVSELFQTHLDFTLQPTTTAEELFALCQKLDIPAGCGDTWDELFFRIFIEKIESQLGHSPVVVKDYPPKLAAYSRIMESGWADRFEFYWKGLEIANAFHEVNDPRIQRQRMEEDNRRKLSMGFDAVALDEEFLKCLEIGLPPSGGIALGVARLFMAFHDIADIGEVR